MRPITKYLIIFVIICAYITAFNYANQGYGYMGYFGPSTGPSVFVMNNYNVYASRSIRTGSTHGSRGVGRGPGAGK